MGKSGCIRAKAVVFGQKWLHSGKVFVFWQSGFIWAKLFYLGKVVVFGTSGCIRTKVVVIGQSS